MKKTILFALTMSVLFACKKQSDSEGASIMGYTTYEEAVKGLGKYAEIFKPVNGSVFADVTKSGFSESYTWNMLARYTETIDGARSNGGDYFINNLKLVYGTTTEAYFPENVNKGLSSSETKDLLQDIWGKNNTIKLIRDGKEVFSNTMYLPNLLKIESVSGEQNLINNFQEITRDNVKVKWNADKNNTNGVVAYLVWTGDMANASSDQQGTRLKEEIAIKFDDSGEVSIPAKYFSSIPKSAIFTIFFIRGNINISETQDSKTYKSYFVSQNTFRFMLKD